MANDSRKAMVGPMHDRRTGVDRISVNPIRDTNVFSAPSLDARVIAERVVEVVSRS